jgi:hypothetical protein
LGRAVLAVLLVLLVLVLLMGWKRPMSRSGRSLGTWCMRLLSTSSSLLSSSSSRRQSRQLQGSRQRLLVMGQEGRQLRWGQGPKGSSSRDRLLLLLLLLIQQQQQEEGMEPQCPVRRPLGLSVLPTLPCQAQPQRQQQHWGGTRASSSI